MLTRRRHKLHALRIRRMQVEHWDPAVMVGPVLVHYRRHDYRHQDASSPRRRINGRWLAARWASKVQWLSSIAHKGSRRGDPRTNMLQKAAERCSLYRHTSMPF